MTLAKKLPFYEIFNHKYTKLYDSFAQYSGMSYFDIMRNIRTICLDITGTASSTTGIPSSAHSITAGYKTP